MNKNCTTNLMISKDNNNKGNDNPARRKIMFLMNCRNRFFHDKKNRHKNRPCKFR